MKNKFYRSLVQKMPMAYAHLRLILDKNGNPEDYGFA